MRARRLDDRTRLRGAAFAPLFALLAFGGGGDTLAGGGETRHCETDALGKMYCARTPEGTAVVDDLGRVLCAPGGCTEWEEDWVCSSSAGGSAGVTPDGPVCDGQCLPPTARECEEL
jgi:hypothetical protein